MHSVTIALLAFLVIALPSAAEAKRAALVIGNSAYVHASMLANPKNDATDFAAVLAESGFEVIAAFDLDKVSFDRKIRDFAAALSNSEAGVFFYAGHGLQVAGRNYLVPVDAELATAEAIEFEMVQLDVVQRIMERNTTTNILFLDACRNNPLARNLARAMGTRSVEIARGLAPVESGVGTLISFSTQPGNVASDGSGRNSPFADALIKRAASSNEDLSAILIDVRNDVRKQTENKQVPWEHSALTGRFYFAGAPPSQAAPAPQPDRGDLERAWAFIKETDDQARLQAFIRQFGDSAYAPMARARLEELRKRQTAVLPAPVHRPTINAPDRSRDAFNGNRQIQWFDTTGCSNPHASFSLTISNDAISSGGERPATGRVDKTGNITFSQSTRLAKTRRYIGRLSGNSGSGRFGTFGGPCAGRFAAKRQ